MSSLAGWQLVPLVDVAESIDYGFTDSASTERVGPRFLRITDIQNGAVDWRTVPYCRYDGTDLDRFGLRSGDIVFARTGATTGKSFLIRYCPEPAVFASYLIRVRPGAKVDPAFLARFFDSPAYWMQITQTSSGTAQPGVNASKLQRLKVPLPPLAEQRRIAAVLDKADDLRAKRRHALATLDILLQSVFLDMFGDPVTNSRYPFKLLSECAEVVSGVTKGRKFNRRKTIMLPYIRVANVQDGHLNLEEIKLVEALPDDLDALRLQSGDVLLTEGGDFDKLGRGAMWKGEVPDCIHQNHIFRVRTDHAIVLPHYFEAYLQTRFAKAYFLRCAKKTTNLASMNMRQLRALPLMLPPVKMQRRFAAVVASVDSRLEDAERGAKASDDLFASLQSAAFAGTLFGRAGGAAPNDNGTSTKHAAPRTRAVAV